MLHAREVFHCDVFFVMTYWQWDEPSACEKNKIEIH